VDMEKKFIQVGHLKEGNYVLIDDFVCQVKSVEKSKPGKHGSAKARITAIGVFDDQKRNLLKPADADTAMPIVERSKGMAIAIVGDQVHVMDEKSYETFTALKPKDVDVKQGLQVEFLRYGKNVRIIRAAKE